MKLSVISERLLPFNMLSLNSIRTNLASEPISKWIMVKLSEMLRAFIFNSHSKNKNRCLYTYPQTDSEAVAELALVEFFGKILHESQYPLYWRTPNSIERVCKKMIKKIQKTVLKSIVGKYVN